MRTQEDKAERTIDRIDTKVHLGGDSQVDDRNVVIAPIHPQRTDPFLLLSEDWFSTRGFEWHPHRGLETVTLVLDGALEHGDNLGHAGALTVGDAQWMTAGRGIIHRELALRNERAHVLQLWVNLPAELKMTDTSYRDLRAADRPVITDAGLRVDVIAGEFDDRPGADRNGEPVSGSLVTMEPSRRFDHRLAGGDRAFFYVLSGTVLIGGRSVTAGQIAWSEPTTHNDESSVTLETSASDHPSVVMIYSGRPIGEPVAMGGPFVMNTQAEIEQAFQDFHQGKFGHIPRQARLD